MGERVDPITVSFIEHWQDRLVAIVLEMGEAMRCTSYSQGLRSRTNGG